MEQQPPRQQPRRQQSRLVSVWNDTSNNHSHFNNNDADDNDNFVRLHDLFQESSTSTTTKALSDFSVQRAMVLEKRSAVTVTSTVTTTTESSSLPTKTTTMDESDVNTTTTTTTSSSRRKGFDATLMQLMRQRRRHDKSQNEEDNDDNNNNNNNDDDDDDYTATTLTASLHTTTTSSSLGTRCNASHHHRTALQQRSHHGNSLSRSRHGRNTSNHSGRKSLTARNASRHSSSSPRRDNSSNKTNNNNNNNKNNWSLSNHSSLSKRSYYIDSDSDSSHDDDDDDGFAVVPFEKTINEDTEDDHDGIVPFCMIQSKVMGTLASETCCKDDEVPSASWHAHNSFYSNRFLGTNTRHGDSYQVIECDDNSTRHDNNEDDDKSTATFNNDQDNSHNDDDHEDMEGEIIPLEASSRKNTTNQHVIQFDCNDITANARPLSPQPTPQPTPLTSTSTSTTALVSMISPPTPYTRTGFIGRGDNYEKDATPVPIKCYDSDEGKDIVPFDPVRATATTTTRLGSDCVRTDTPLGPVKGYNPNEGDEIVPFNPSSTSTGTPSVVANKQQPLQHVNEIITTCLDDFEQDDDWEMPFQKVMSEIKSNPKVKCSASPTKRALACRQGQLKQKQEHIITRAKNTKPAFLFEIPKKSKALQQTKTTRTLKASKIQNRATSTNVPKKSTALHQAKSSSRSMPDFERDNNRTLLSEIKSNAATQTKKSPATLQRVNSSRTSQDRGTSWSPKKTKRSLLTNSRSVGNERTNSVRNLACADNTQKDNTWRKDDASHFTLVFQSAEHISLRHVRAPVSSIQNDQSSNAAGEASAKNNISSLRTALMRRTNSKSNLFSEASVVSKANSVMTAPVNSSRQWAESFVASTPTPTSSSFTTSLWSSNKPIVKQKSALNLTMNADKSLEKESPWGTLQSCDARGNTLRRVRSSRTIARSLSGEWNESLASPTKCPINLKFYSPSRQRYKTPTRQRKTAQEEPELKKSISRKKIKPRKSASQNSDHQPRQTKPKTPTRLRPNSHQDGVTKARRRANALFAQDLCPTKTTTRQCSRPRTRGNLPCD